MKTTKILTMIIYIIVVAIATFVFGGCNAATKFVSGYSNVTVEEYDSSKAVIFTDDETLFNAISVKQGLMLGGNLSDKTLDKLNQIGRLVDDQICILKGINYGQGTLTIIYSKSGKVYFKSIEDILSLDSNEVEFNLTDKFCFIKVVRQPV